MSLSLYMDHNVRAEITEGLRQRGVDVVTSAEDGTNRLPDAALLDRATELGRVLVSMDEDLLAEASRRQRSGEVFRGIVFSRQLSITIGQAVDDLELIAKVYEPVEMHQRVEFIPL